MTQHRPIVLLVAALLAIPPALHAQPVSAQPETVQIVNASRGDVLRVSTPRSERVVMLYGLTCPDPQSPVGARALEYTRNQVDGKKLTMSVRYQQPKVDYVEITLENGTILNHELLRNGLAKLDSVTAADDQAYIGLQDRARVQELGLWKPADETLTQPAPVASSAPAPLRTASVTPVDPSESDLDRYKRVKELKADVESLVAVDHWNALSDTDKEAIRRDAANRDAARALSAEDDLQYVAEDLDAVRSDLAGLDAAIARAEADLEAYSVDNEELAVDELYDSDPDFRRFEQQLADATSAVEIAIDQFGPDAPTTYQLLDEQAIAQQMADERRRALALEEDRIRLEYAQQRDMLQPALDELLDQYDELALEYEDVEADYQIAQAETEAREQATGAAQAAIDALDQAAQRGRRSPLTEHAIGIWKGRGSSQTPPFDIVHDVWVLDYDAGDRAGTRALRISVRRESDDAVIQQILDNRLPHQSFEVLTAQGGMYLTITAPDDLEWSVTVSGYSPSGR